MLKAIENFLRVMRNWKVEIPIKNFDLSNNDETSQIVRMQKEENIDEILKIWHKKINNGYFELPHPNNSDVTTRAIYNVKYSMGNFVIMNDETNKNPWIFGQCVNFIDLIITETAIYKASNFNCENLLSSIEKLSHLQNSHFEYKSKKFGFLVSQTRPYHFFYDQLKFFLKIKKTNINSFKNAFFSPDDYSNVNEEKASVFLFPTVIANNTLQTGLAKKLNEEMEAFVYQESIVNLNHIIEDSSKEYDLVLWLGITGQKRSWLQQVDGYISIIQELQKHFPVIKVYIDGITATDGDTVYNADDVEIFDDIKKGLKNLSDITVISLIGKDYRTKICYCNTTDFFIANAGTGAMVPLRFNKKPGVLHRNTELFTFPDTYPKTVKLTELNYIKDVDLENKKRNDFLSYHTPWQHIYNLTIEVINNLKGTEILPIKVPKMVDFINDENSKKHTKNPKEKNNAFNNLGSKIKKNHQSADILREVALSFERAGDISTALTIMKKAVQLRPHGSYIKRKVTEYLDKIDNQ